MTIPSRPTPYEQAARLAFLARYKHKRTEDGLAPRSPDEVVRLGLADVREWCEVLGEHRKGGAA